MARVTVEDCIVQVPNRFELVMFAASARATLGRRPDHRRSRPRRTRRGAARDRRDQARPGVLKDSMISGMQKHADIDKPEEVNEMAELEQELAPRWPMRREAAQPKARRWPRKTTSSSSAH